MEIGKYENNLLKDKSNAGTCDQLEVSKEDENKLKQSNASALESVIEEIKEKFLEKRQFESSNKKVVNRNKKRNKWDENPRVSTSSHPSEDLDMQKRIILKRGITWKNISRSYSEEKEVHSDKGLNSGEYSFPSRDSFGELSFKGNKCSLTHLDIKEPRAEENTDSFHRRVSQDFNVWRNNNNNTPVTHSMEESEKSVDHYGNIKSSENSERSFSPFITITTTPYSNSDSFYESSPLEEQGDFVGNAERINADLENVSDHLGVSLLYEGNVLNSHKYVAETNLEFANKSHSFSKFSPQKLILSVSREENYMDKTSDYCKKLHERDDSDEMDDTWHHKNIKEKIQNILGKKLNLHKIGRISASTVGKNLKTSACTKEIKNVGEVNRTSTNRGGNYIINKKLDFTSNNPIPNFMNLTFLTESDDDSAELSPLQLDLDCTKKESVVKRWELLESKAREKQNQSVHAHRLQWQLKSIRMNMENILNCCSAYATDTTFESFSQISISLDKIKSLINECDSLKLEISALNTQVHRYSLEVAPSFMPLKDEMTELYRIWDETHRRVNSELSRMKQVETTYHAWEEQKMELNRALKQDSDALKLVDAAVDNGILTESVTASVHDVAKLLNERRKYSFCALNKDQFLSQDVFESCHDIKKKEDHFSDSGTSGYESCSSDDLSERERRLAYLKRLAKDLEASLEPGCHAWKEINSTLDQAEKELKELQDHCRYLIFKTAETFGPSSKNLCFSSNSKRRILTREGKNSRSPRREKRMKILGSRRDFIWRVARAAVPFQVALMLLVCVACLLEPNCCDSVNTLNLSFTPQLRFVHGSPPI